MQPWINALATARPEPPWQQPPDLGMRQGERLHTLTQTIGGPLLGTGLLGRSLLLRCMPFLLLPRSSILVKNLPAGTASSSDGCSRAPWQKPDTFQIPTASMVIYDSNHPGLYRWCAVCKERRSSDCSVYYVTTSPKVYAEVLMFSCKTK